MGEVLTGPWAARRRPPRAAFWAPVWDELPVLPSTSMEEVIAEVVAEIADLRAKLHLEPMQDGALWLAGFAKQVNESLWPPPAPSEYIEIFRALKALKRQLLSKYQDGNRITKNQIKAIWAVVRCSPYLDKDELYRLIELEFPRAPKKGSGAERRPSLSGLTSGQAGHLLDVLKHPAKAKARRRA